MATRPALIFFVKFPAPGKVKTRLAAELGADRAVEIYRTLVAAICARLPGDCDVIVQFDPPEKKREVEAWLQPLLPGATFAPQAAGDLGARLANAFQNAFESGYGHVAVIGSDCVEITPTIFAEAFASLDSHEIAIGPSADGGYYLLALKEPQPPLFAGIAWSTADVFAQTLAAAQTAGLSVARLPQLRDVDTAGDWQAAEAFLASPLAPFAPHNHAMQIDKPIVFEPLFMERVWGGRRLETLFHKRLPASAKIGEAWEIVDREEAQSVVHRGPLRGKTLHELWTENRVPIFGRRVPDTARFPLLFKLLDAQERLSVQVHPPAAIAPELNGEPKTEMWFVVENYGDGDIFAGLEPNVTRADFERALNDGSVEEKIHRVPVQAGDTMFIPSGRVHAIGAGNVIVEVQQNSDTTYRVFDWNRVGLDGHARTLHVEESLRSIDFADVAPALQKPEGDLLVESDYFRIERWKLDAPREAAMPGEFAIFTCLDGVVECAGLSFQPGDFFLVPAALENRQIKPQSGSADVLRTTLP